jgi:inositol 1,4,5-triphosphate receptor type 1
MHLLRLFAQAGDAVRFFHKEIEAYLVAEGLFDAAIHEDGMFTLHTCMSIMLPNPLKQSLSTTISVHTVHFRIRPMDQNNPKSLFPSTSAITYWQVELEDGPCNGGHSHFVHFNHYPLANQTGNVVRWEQQCRLKHMTTRKYLRTDGKTTSLSDSHSDPKTVFRLHPVIKESEQIAYETYCRIEHVVTGTWLHASGDEYQRNIGGKTKADSTMASLNWTTALLRKVDVSQEMQYDDAFTLQKVDDISEFNFMAGMVPFLQKLINDVSTELFLFKTSKGNLISIAEKGWTEYKFQTDARYPRSKNNIAIVC